MILNDAWLPTELADMLTQPALRLAPLYDLLANAGIKIDRVRHEITAQIAGSREAQLLDTTIGAALLCVNRIAFLADAPHHHLSVLLSPSRSRLLWSQSADALQRADGLTIAHDVAQTRAGE